MQYYQKYLKKLCKNTRSMYLRLCCFLFGTKNWSPNLKSPFYFTNNFRIFWLIDHVQLEHTPEGFMEINCRSALHFNNAIYYGTYN